MWNIHLLECMLLLFLQKEFMEISTFPPKHFPVKISPKCRRFPTIHIVVIPTCSVHVRSIGVMAHACKLTDCLCVCCSRARPKRDKLALSCNHRLKRQTSVRSRLSARQMKSTKHCCGCGESWMPTLQMARGKSSSQGACGV